MAGGGGPADEMPLDVADAARRSIKAGGPRAAPREPEHCRWSSSHHVPATLRLSLNSQLPTSFNIWTSRLGRPGKGLTAEEITPEVHLSSCLEAIRQTQIRNYTIHACNHAAVHSINMGSGESRVAKSSSWQNYWFKYQEQSKVFFRWLVTILGEKVIKKKRKYENSCRDLYSRSLLETLSQILCSI